mmetsp:Transcript_54898/g.130362  ORF Transcript_54898/g.130362 Transcript_54898/m.130362 type:complete len:143 (+) Transcript_54898:73-501(+)
MTSLQSLLAQKAVLEKELVEIEKEIFDQEGAYLEDTAMTGNILKGWDGYFQSMAQQRGGPRSNKVKNSDRVFSRSSVTAPKGDPSLDDEPASAGPVLVTRKDVNKRPRDRDKQRDSKLPGRAKLGRTSAKRQGESDESADED